jgi:hypothetical protein
MPFPLSDNVENQSPLAGDPLARFLQRVFALNWLILAMVIANDFHLQLS